MRDPLIVLALAVFGLGACTYSSGIDDPVVRKVQWFSYVNADDMRARCASGAGDEIRLVYNAHYDEQVRTYEIIADGAGGAYYTARAAEGTGFNLSRVSLEDPLASLRWRRSEARLDGETFTDLLEAIAMEGGFEGAPRGMRLKSWGFYWTMAACMDGEMVFHAWTYPSRSWDRGDDLAFATEIAALDETGLSFNPPRPPDPREAPTRNRSQGNQGSLHFVLEVGDNGLVGYPGG